MKKIDATGKPCPVPVIEVKKAIRELEKSGGIIEVSVDNDIAVENIKKMIQSLGIELINYEVVGEHRSLQMLVPEKGLKENSTNDLVIAFGSNEMGKGSPKLGEILLKSYIHSLTELDVLPKQLFFFNSGAKLTIKKSNVVDDLFCLTEKGVVVSTCGACLDFYGITTDLAVGEITNMYTICETMASAEKIINF